MREMDRIQEKLMEIEDDQVRREILAAQRVLLNTFDVMMKEARGALNYRKQLSLSLDEAEKAAVTFNDYLDGMDDCLSNRKALIAYIIRLGEEAILPDDEKRNASVGRMLYVVSDAEGFAGVYSSVENARNAGLNDELNVIPLILTENDAALKRYVCMVEGEWTSLRMKDGQCMTETCSTNPIWGCSVQSCMSAISRLGGLHGFALKSLYIYEIDRTYPWLMNAADRFKDLFKAYARQQELSLEILVRDYIQQYFDEISCEVEYIEKYYSEDTLRILNQISDKYGLNVKQKEWMRIELCRRLSKEELLEKEELFKRVEDCIPRRRGGQRKKKLKDYLE